ncbi:MAG: 50S ribosomal protein L34e [Candidatus Woesearchaeota archaeon]
MLKPHATRSLRRIKKRTPGGKLIIQYKKRTPKIAHCAKCKKKLHGIPRVRQVAVGKLTKSKRRPERPYGGMLCSVCSRKLIIEKSKELFKEQ